jgi:hypothetical protein
VVECLNTIIHNEATSAKIKGIKINSCFSLTHLLFLDNILLFCEGNISYTSTLKDILHTFCITIGMQINMDKSSLISWRLSEAECQHTYRNMDTSVLKNMGDLKYIGFNPKANNYGKKD